MNLWFRLLWLLVTARFRGALVPPFGVSRVRFRVWPTDLDTNLHMNNGRYLTLGDLGRTDLMLRGGLWKAVVKNGWLPMLSGAAIRYRRELKPFRPFVLESRIAYWSEKTFVMEHRFVNHMGDIAAIALVRGGLYDRKARKFIDVADIFAEMGMGRQMSPPPTPEISAFIDMEEGLKRAAGAARTAELNALEDA